MTTVKSIVAAFKLARERREMERRRQRVDELFSTTSVGSATTAPAPLASHSSSAFSTTPSAPTSTTSTSIATATLSSTATRELLHPLPARCLTPGRSHGECAISHVESLTVAVRAFASKPSTTTIDAQLEFNAMEQRYTTNLAHTDSRAVVLLGEARDVHNAHMVFDKMTNQKVMNLWPLHLDEFDRKQWPPPIQLEIIDSGVILRPIPWPSFTSDTVVTGSSFSTLFSDIYGWYLHHWFEFAIKCCAMEWDITWPDCILIDVQAVMEKIMTDHMSGHQMCDGILLTNNCEFSMQRCKKHLEFLDTALLLEGNGRVQTTGILCLHPLRVCHTLLTTLIQHSVTGDEVDAQLEPPWPPTLQFKVQVYGVQLRPTFWSSFIFHTVWQLEKAPSRSWHIVQFERLYPGDRMRLHCEAESLVVAFQLLNSISVLCVTVTIEVQLIWCCQMNIQFKIPWTSLYCSEYELHCHMFSQYPQQHAICAFNYLHGHCIEGIHGQAIVQSNPSTIQCWQYWLTLLDSTMQVVPHVEDVVVLAVQSVLVLCICYQLMMGLQQRNGLFLMHMVFRSEEWLWHDWPFYLAEEFLQVAMKMCIALCEFITSQSTGWNAARQSKGYSYNGENILSSSSCVQASELNESNSLSSVTGISSQVAILKWTITCQLSGDYRLLQVKTGVTPRLKSHLLFGGVHTKLLTDAEQIGHITCCLPFQLVWYGNAICHGWRNLVLVDYASERQVIALQSYAHVVIWLMGVVMLLREFWNYKSLATCTFRMELCQEAKVQLKQAVPLMFVVVVLKNQLMSKIPLSQADRQGSLLHDWSLVGQLKLRSIWFLVISRYHYLSHFSSYISIVCMYELQIVRNIRSDWWHILYLTLYYYALNQGCNRTNQMEKSSQSAFHLDDGWLIVTGCSSVMFQMRYVLLASVSMDYLSTMVGNYMLVQLKRGSLNQAIHWISSNHDYTRKFSVGPCAYEKQLPRH